MKMPTPLNGDNFATVQDFFQLQQSENKICGTILSFALPYEFLRDDFVLYIFM